MHLLWYFRLLLFLSCVGCNNSNYLQIENSENNQLHAVDSNDSLSLIKAGGALLLQNFNSLDELRSVVQIKYTNNQPAFSETDRNASKVILSYNSRGRKMETMLESGVSETDFQNARKGNFIDKAKLGLISPYTVVNKSDLERVEILSRRRDHIYGEGDVAFYDLAEKMVFNISYEDKLCMDSAVLSEKGYLNTFNHVTSQTFMTTIFSEELADFVGDVHERSRLPELVTGNFTKVQLADLNEGAVDNYIDIINNEWGQELGKELRNKYNISGKTIWTPYLLANFLNDIQSYYSWVFQIGFTPFKVSDELVIRFSDKINSVNRNISQLRQLK